LLVDQGQSSSTL